MKNILDDGSFLLDQLQLSLDQFVPKRGTAGDEASALYPLLVAQAHPLGICIAFPLVHHGEEGGEELAGQFRGVDVLLLKADPHPQGLELPDGLKALLGVSSEPRGGLD